MRVDEGGAGQGGSVRRGRGKDESFNGRGGGARRAGGARAGARRGGTTGRADAPLILGRISSTKRIFDDA